MPFTLFHGMLSATAAALFTRYWRLIAIAFLGGCIPDLDGVPILFDLNLYRQLHHVLLHPPVYGLVFGAIVAFALWKMYLMDWKLVLAAFFAGYALHSITDLFFTDWPIRMLWPLSEQQFSYPVLMQYNIPFALAVGLAFGIMVLSFYPKKKKRAI